MKRNWIRTDRLWCLFLILAVCRVSESSSKTIYQVKLPIPTRESLPQVAEVLRAAAYLEDDDEVDKNFQGHRNGYKRLPRKLGSENPETSSELQEYQGVMGRPGVDFPILPSIPRTDFSCKKMKKSGYYADPETDCQVFHICDNGMKVSFLCPNGTVFRQSHLICDWWFRVDCERSIEMYEESAEQLATDQRAFKERTEALAKAMLKVQTTTTQTNTDRVVTDRSFGPSTTVFNSESRLPDRTRYFGDYSAGENQVPAETGSFAGNRFSSNINNNYYSQSKSPVGNWDTTANFQSATGNNNNNNNNNYYQTQSSTTAQPTWNQAANNNNYQGGSNLQTQSSTTAQPTWNQVANNNKYQGGSNLQTQSSTNTRPDWDQATADRNNNNYNNNYYNNYQSGSNQGQSLTTAQPTWNQVAVDINNSYQSGFYQAQSTTTAPQPSWNQAAAVNSNNNNYYQSGSYQTQSTTTVPQPSWNQAAAVNSNNNNYYQSGSYRTQSTTTAAQPTWNQAAAGNNYYQSGSYPSTTTAQPVSGVQNVNSFHSDYQSQYAQPNAQNQVDTSGSQAVYQPQPTTVVPQPNPNQANNHNNNNNNNNYQPGNSNKNNNYQTPSTTVAAGQNPWNNHQGPDDDFHTEVTSYQTSPTATPDVTADGQSADANSNSNYGDTTNFPEPAKTTAAQVNGWSHQAVNDLTLSTDQQPPTAVTTVQPDWNPQEAADNTAVRADQQPQQQLQSRLPYNQRPTASTFPAAENEKQNAPARESQVPAESASFVGHNNAPLYGFNLPNDYYRTLVPQTNPPATTYPATGSYPNDYQGGAFSYVEYNQDISTTVGDAVTTTQEPPMTTVFDYTGDGGHNNNATLPPSGETLIPNMINSLQTFHADNNNNALYETFDTSQTNADDDFNSIALYFNHLNDPQGHAVTTVASDSQFNGYFEQTSRAYTNGISPFAGTKSVETTTPVAATAAAAVVPSKGLHIPAVLTHNTKQAYDKLFTNDTKQESTTAPATTAVTAAAATAAAAAGQPTADVGSKGTATKPGNTVNLGLALNLNHSSAELRELAAVFTRALTAYLDDPENFRKILAEVRPTEPPGPKTGGGAADEQEVLDFSDDPKGGYRSTHKPMTTASGTSETDDGGMPQHVNALADLSATIPHYTTSPLIEITSKFTEAPNAAAASGLREYAPLADGEQLQTAGSHSFYSSRDNSVETPSKTVRPPPQPTSTLTWTVSPIIDTDGDTKATTPQLPPVYFTTAAAAEDIETTAIMQKAKEMFSHLNESDAGILLNVMRTAHANDTVKRLVLLLVNDPNKENSPEQTRHNIIEALLENRGSTAADQAYESSSPTSAFSPAPSPAPSSIPFGQRIHEDGSPIGASEGEQHKKSRKGGRRRVHVQRSRQVTAAAITTPSSNAWHGANDVGPGLSADSDARAVELLKSLYSIASKWS